MFQCMSATTVAAAGFLLSAAFPVSAALESDVDLSPLPEVQVSYDITSSVPKRAGCDVVKATILVDDNGRMVGLLYTTDPDAAC